MSDHKINVQQCNEILSLYEAGKTTRFIANEFSVSQPTVLKAIRRAGGRSKPPPTKSPVTEDQANAIRVACDAGRPFQEVAREFKFSVYAVVRSYRRSGGKPRPSGCPRGHRNGNGTRVSVAESNEIRLEHEAGKSVCRISLERNRSIRSVRMAIKRSGGKTRSHKDLRLINEPMERLASERYAAGKSCEEIGASLGCDGRLVSKYLGKLGISRRSPGNKRTTEVNESAFDGAEFSEESSYWVGMLLADGNVYRDKRGSYSVRLGLADPDGPHVKKFADFLGYSGSLSHRPAGFHTFNLRRRDGSVYYHTSPTKPQTRVRINSKKLCKSLARYGIEPRKSLTAELKVLESNRHAWRGVIDGDGTVSHNHKRRKDGLLIQLVGSKKTIGQFIRYATDVLCLPVKKRRRNPKPEGRKIYRVGYKSWQALAIIRNLYDGCSVALPRKWETAKKVIGQFEGRYYGDGWHLYKTKRWTPLGQIELPFSALAA